MNDWDYAAGITKGTHQERQRITKLIEARIAELEEWESPEDNYAAKILQLCIDEIKATDETRNLAH